MDQDSKSASFSESLVLDNAEKGVVVAGIKDNTISPKSGKINISDSFLLVLKIQ